MQIEVKEYLISFSAESSCLISKNIRTKIYRTIILPVVLYGSEARSFSWGRNIGWGCLRIGCWEIYLGLRGRRLQESGEDYIMRSFMLCTTHEISFRWWNQGEWEVGHVVYMADRRGAYRVLVGWPLRRPRLIWEGNIKMDLQRLGGRDMNCIALTQDSERWWVLVNAVMGLQFP